MSWASWISSTPVSAKFFAQCTRELWQNGPLVQLPVQLKMVPSSIPNPEHPTLWLPPADLITANLNKGWASVTKAKERFWNLETYVRRAYNLQMLLSELVLILQHSLIDSLCLAHKQAIVPWTVKLLPKASSTVPPLHRLNAHENLCVCHVRRVLYRDQNSELNWQWGPEKGCGPWPPSSFLTSSNLFPFVEVHSLLHQTGKLRNRTFVWRRRFYQGAVVFSTFVT